MATKTISGLYDGATTKELDSLSIQTAAALIVDEPEYARLSARLLATYIQKEVSNQEIHSFSQKEPDLEEEALRLAADAGDLVVERQTLEAAAAPVTLTMPDGSSREVALAEEEPGLFRARVEDAPLGLYRASDGDLTALAHVGPTDPREFRTLISTTGVLEPIADAPARSQQRRPRPPANSAIQGGRP